MVISITSSLLLCLASQHVCISLVNSTLTSGNSPSTRDYQGFEKPLGVRGRVVRGRGQGWIFEPLKNPYPEWGSEGYLSQQVSCIMVITWKIKYIKL
jgi:hypothetical protein